MIFDRKDLYRVPRVAPTPEKSSFKRQSLRPYSASGRPGWLVKWTNPHGRRSTASLSTRDETEAKAVALDLERLLNDPTYWDIKDGDPRCVHFHPRALEIFCRRPARACPSTAAVSEDAIQFFRTMPSDWSPKSWYIPVPELNELRIELANKERMVARLEQEKEVWNRERMELRKRLNKHCTATMSEALEEFERYYRNGHAPETVSQVLRVNRQLAEAVGMDTLAGLVTGAEINQLLYNYTNAGRKVCQRTRRRVKAYLSTFWSWAVRQYELNGNPIAHVHVIPAGAPESIEAVRSFQDLTTMVSALADRPYWQAWVAVATLAGPRWGEQAAIRIADVNLNDGYIRIAGSITGRGTKTGRQRNVPIERTTLMPILKKFMADEPHRNGLLFPSISAGHGATKDGLWRAQTWHKYWFGGHNPDGEFVQGISQALRAKRDAYFWEYGPREWRHCAGTAMGHAGMSTLRISQWLGNSEAICRRHYVAPSGAASWPLKWTVNPYIE